MKPFCCHRIVTVDYYALSQRKPSGGAQSGSRPSRILWKENSSSSAFISNSSSLAPPLALPPPRSSSGFNCFVSGVGSWLQKARLFHLSGPLAHFEPILGWFTQRGCQTHTCPSSEPLQRQLNSTRPTAPIIFHRELKKYQRFLSPARAISPASTWPLADTNNVPASSL